MKRFLWLLFVGLLLPACERSHRPFWDRPCAVTHFTAKGISWQAYGPTYPPGGGVWGDNWPDSLQYLYPEDISAALDAWADDFQAAYPALDVYGTIRALRLVIVDDYVFPSGGSAADSNSQWAAGLTESIVGGPAVMVVLALWSRYDAPPSALPPTGMVDPWTARWPGLNGYDHWRWGVHPFLPAFGYEFSHWVFNVAEPTGPVDIKPTQAP